MWAKRDFSKVSPMWEAKDGEGRGVAVGRLKKIIEEKYHAEIGDYWDLHKWSTDHISEFWSEMWEFFGVICSKKFDKVVDENVPITKRPQWFEGARMNYAENMLKYRDDHVALVLTGEDREPERVTYSEMYEEVRMYAAAFRKLGLKKNDIVSCYMSNRKEAVIAMAAVASIGAIWTGALPLLGAPAVLSRFKVLKAKFLLTVDRFQYNGEEIDMLNKVKSIVNELPSIEKVIIVPSKPASLLKDISGIRNSCFLNEFLQSGVADDGTVPPLQFEQLPFSHPVWINFTSGTTGVPKGVIHGFGFLFCQANFWSLHLDTVRNSVHLSVTPMGSGGWNLYTALHCCGCTVILYEGDQFYRTPMVFWDLVDRFQVTHAYILASTLREYQKIGCVPTAQHNLSALKILMSGASVVPPQSWDFVHDKVKNDVLFGSFYGCTEVGLCLVSSTSLPIYKGEIQASLLGLDVQIVNESGNSVLGEIGEVTVAKPTPSLALGLWGDPDGSTFYNSYCSRFPGKMSCGDYGLRNPITCGFEICCRSDDALHQGVYRFSCGEIYNVVDTFPEVEDSLCASLYGADMSERFVLFLQMREGHAVDAQLADRIRGAVKKSLTEKHVPHFILETKDIPYNFNGKKLEIIVKRIINQMPYSTEAVRNPESLKNFFNIPELQR